MHQSARGATEEVDPPRVILPVRSDEAFSFGPDEEVTAAVAIGVGHASDGGAEIADEGLVGGAELVEEGAGGPR